MANNRFNKQVSPKGYKDGGSTLPKDPNRKRPKALRDLNKEGARKFEDLPESKQKVYRKKIRMDKLKKAGKKIAKAMVPGLGAASAAKKLLEKMKSKKTSKKMGGASKRGTVNRRPKKTIEVIET